MSRERQSWVTLGLFGICAVALAVVAVFVRSHLYSLYDDAFIYLRYAKNLRAGCGLRFNCDDPPVEGFSGPLHLAILVTAGLFTRKLVLATQVTGAITTGTTICCAVAAVGSPAFARERGVQTLALAAGVASVLAFDDFVLLNSVTGMETSLAGLVVSLSLLAALRDRRRWFLAITLVSPLVRPECLLLVLFLPAFEWARSRRVVALSCGATAAIFLVRWLVFRDLFPNTYWAKAGGSGAHLWLGASYAVGVFRDFPFIGLAPLALVHPELRRVTTYWLLVSAGWFAFFLRSGGDTFDYSRLAYPIVPALTGLGMLGVGGLVARFSSRLGRRWRVLAFAAPLAIAAAVALRAAVAHNLAPQHGFDNVTRWAAVGRYLKANHAGKTVATVPIGAIGYYSGLRVIDLVGLTAPAIAKAGRSVPPDRLERMWIGHERHNLEWVLAQKPDLVVTTKYQAAPWFGIGMAQAGFWADWLILQAMKDGTAPYVVRDAPIAPGLHWLMFERIQPSKPQ
jgi:arabinofuranosyltransferase